MSADRWLGWALVVPVYAIVAGAVLSVALDVLFAISQMWRKR